MPDFDELGCFFIGGLILVALVILAICVVLAVVVGASLL